MRVLFLDDRAPNAVAVQAVLSDAGFDVTVARDVPQALVALDADEFAVVLTQQRMAGLRGVDFLERCAREHPAPMRLLMTSYSDAPAAEAAIARGIIHQLVWTPWTSGELTTAVRAAARSYELSFVINEDTPLVPREIDDDEMPAITEKFAAAPRLVSR